MKAQVSESMSSVNVEYAEISLREKYKIDVIEFNAEVSITAEFEIDCQVTIQVAVESDEGVVIIEGEEWFYNLAKTHNSKYNHIRMEELSIKESRVDEADLDQFLQDISDSIVEIKFSA